MIIDIAIATSKRCIGDKSLFITFPYNDDLIKCIRSFPTRYWDSKLKRWEVPKSKLPSVLRSMSKGNIINIKCYKEDLFGETTKLNNIPKEYKFKTKPYEHQVDGVNYGLAHSKFILGDEQGLGKTHQVINIAVCRKQNEGLKRCLIICCVNGNKYNWKDEVSIHSNETGYILGSRVRKNGKMYIGSNEDRLHDLIHLPKDFFLITNIETLRYKKAQEITLKSGRKKRVYTFPIAEQLVKLIDAGELDMIAIDEVHRGANSTSQQGQCLLELSKAKYIIPMTGTPLRNRPLDLYTPLRLVGAEDHSLWAFKNHYCVFDGFGGKQVVGYKNMGELQETLDDVMLRRLKSETLDLPEKIHVTEYIELTKDQQKLYTEVLQNIKQNIDKIRLCPDPLTQLLRLRQVTGNPNIISSRITDSPKYDRMCEMCEDLAQNSKKAIVYSNWTSVINPAFERLQKAGLNPALYTGQNTKEREAEKSRFMTDDSCKVICGTIGAMGTGLTLTAATTVIFLDEPWTRSSKDQAEDRAHRIGTTEPVTIVTLIAKDTIDEKINQLVYRKGKMSDIIVDKEENLTTNPNVLDYLISDGG